MHLTINNIIKYKQKKLCILYFKSEEPICAIAYEIWNL